MHPFRPYHPPVLDTKITIRSLRDRPDQVLDDFGRPTGDAVEWGTEVRANRRDTRPGIDMGLDGVDTQLEAFTVWTIRYRDIPPEIEVVAPSGDVYEPIGLPLRRGGANGGLAVYYLEIYTRKAGA